MATVVEDRAYRYAIKNAFLHDGKAELSAVIGKLIALDKNINLPKEIQSIKRMVEQVNSMSFDDIESEYHKFSDTYELKPKPEREGLPELDWVSPETPIVTRFAPNPSGSLHFGHARAVWLNYGYAKKYGGSFLLRFDDTDPKIKKSIENAEAVYKRDLDWMGCQVDQTFFASDRLEIYYNYLRKLLEMGKAYVCDCPTEKWRALTKKKIACPHRESDPFDQLAAFQDMIEHKTKEGEAVLRVKTDLQHNDPSVRDWWAAKIVDRVEHPNPKTHGKHVWPSYNFASAIDDHELGITLIIRGQEHAQNGTKQKYVYEYFGWDYPHAIYYGRIKLEGALVSKSKIKSAVESGEFSGLDDPRVGTIENLRARGIQPKAIQEIIFGLGINPSDATVSVDALYDINRKLIDPMSVHVTLIPDPIPLEVQYCPAKTAVIPWHPDFPEKGEKTFALREGNQTFHVSKKEVGAFKPGETFRLRNAYNVKLTSAKKERFFAEFVGEQKTDKATVLWQLEKGVPVEITLPDAKVLHGFVESELLHAKTTIVYFEKTGFAVITHKSEKLVKALYSHR